MQKKVLKLLPEDVKVTLYSRLFHAQGPATGSSFGMRMQTNYDLSMTNRTF